MNSALSELTEGTDEWSNKLQDVNDKAEELLEKYPELAKYASFTNGKMSISEAGIQELQNKLEQQKSVSQLMSGAANQTKYQTDSDLAFRNIQREISWTGSGISDAEVQRIISIVASNQSLLTGTTAEIENKLKSTIPGLSDQAYDGLATNASRILDYVQQIASNNEIIASNSKINGMNALKANGFDTSRKDAEAVAFAVGNASVNKNSSYYKQAVNKYSKIEYSADENGI